MGFFIFNPYHNTMKHSFVYTSLLPLSHFEKRLFEYLLSRIATKYGFDPNWLMTIMCFETIGQFKTDVYYHSGKVGILPFSAQAAKRLGTTQQALAGLNHFEQLMYIALYFNRYNLKGRIRSFRELFLAIHFPHLLNKRRDTIVFKSHSEEYQANKWFDADSKGYVRLIDMLEAVERFLPERTPNGLPIPRRMPINLIPKFRSKLSLRIWISLAILIYRKQFANTL